MRTLFASAALLSGLLLLTGCRAPGTTRQAVFIEGRAVTAAGDTLFAVALPDTGGILRLEPGGGIRDTMGLGVLHRPLTIQWIGNRWYVSDLDDGAPVVRTFTAAGDLQGTLDLGSHTARPHHFAALSDERVVVEAPDGRLVAISPDGAAETFVPADAGPRPSLLLAAQDGVLHAVPDRALTLYNRFGRIRWRVEWPWVETAHMSAVTLDSRGRIHLLSGAANADAFIVYSLEATSGEVVRWSEPEGQATFVVERLGEVLKDPTGRWRLP